MNEVTVERLLALNQAFYDRFAEPFAATRTRPQEGFFKLLDYLPQSSGGLLDVGCGDGRFGRFCLQEGIAGHYTGVDFSNEMLEVARRLTEPGEFFRSNLSAPDCLAGLGNYELVSCLATMQHIPGRENRLRLLKEMESHLAEDGRIVLSNWQFLDSERQRRKIIDWREAGIEPGQVERHDYLLTWERGGRGRRYVAFIDAAETAALAEAAGLKCAAQFRSDGREGDLNLYTILVV